MINIAADGGGSKLLALAFDDDLNVLAAARSGGVNALFMNAEDVENNINIVSDKLFAELTGKTGISANIGSVYCTIVGNIETFIKAIERHAEVNKIKRLNEGQTGILAGTLTTDGLLALSGTGSDCWLVRNGEKIDMIGGWGQYFGDEGSGFYMGREAIIAAIKAADGRGPKTELETLVPAALGFKKSLWEVCTLHTKSTFRNDVSSLTKAVETACRHGDRVAIGIVEKSADEIACAAITLMKKNGYSRNNSFSFTTSGGTWKTSERMTEYFVSKVKKEFPKAVFCKPEFEPIVGCVIRYIYDKGEIPQVDILREKFRDYLL